MGCVPISRIWISACLIRGLRRVEQLVSESELLLERSLIDLRYEILKMNVRYLEGVSRILSHRIEDDYHGWWWKTEMKIEQLFSNLDLSLLGLRDFKSAWGILGIVEERWRWWFGPQPRFRGKWASATIFEGMAHKGILALWMRHSDDVQTKKWVNCGVKRRWCGWESWSGPRMARSFLLSPEYPIWKIMIGLTFN